MDKKLQNIYLVSCILHSLLIPQDLWQAHYQILSKNFLKEFIKLNVNTDTMTKIVKLADLHTK